MRRALAIVLVLAACGGDGAPTTTADVPGPVDRAASDYASSAMRALDGTAFEVLDAADVADVVAGLCEGLGVGAIGVAAADTGIVAGDRDVAIFLEVLRTGLDQVCEDRVVVDLTAIYLGTIANAVSSAGVGAAYDEIAAIRAAPVACAALDRGTGAGPALLDVVATLFGVTADSIDGLEGVIDDAQGLVAGAVLASAAALLCPEHLGTIEDLVGSL